MAYEEQRKYILEKMCLNLVTTLGLPLVEGTVKALSNREISEARSSQARWGPIPGESSHATLLATAHEPTISVACPKLPALLQGIFSRPSRFTSSFDISSAMGLLMLSQCEIGVQGLDSLD